jgi:hypothetical protein
MHGLIFRLTLRLPNKQVIESGVHAIQHLHHRRRLQI